MLKTLNECEGATSENDDIPPDVLPVAIWFDSVNDLSNGLGYESEDAYNNPLSRLTFQGARIDRSSPAEWEAWRKQSADAFVERGALPGPWGYDYPISPGDFGKYVTECRGYRRVRLPEVIRGKIRPLWPAERPRFWSPSNEDDTGIADLLNDWKVEDPPGVSPWFKRFGTPGTGGGVEWSGVPVKSGRWVQRPPHVPSRWPTEIYPSLWPPLISIQPVTAAQYGSETETYVQKLEFRAGALNGFAACQNGNDLTLTAMQAADPKWLTKRHVFEVDGYVVRERGNEPVFFLKPAFVFERDEFVFAQFSTLL
jgi:hypothetical protein